MIGFFFSFAFFIKVRKSLKSLAAKKLGRLLINWAKELSGAKTFAKFLISTLLRLDKREYVFKPEGERGLFLCLFIAKTTRFDF